jgi:hypothetical protein
MNASDKKEWSQLAATVLGVVTALCTAAGYLSYALTVIELGGAGFDAPPFYPGMIFVIGLILTLPPAVLCTVIALALVGPRHSKLAWISLSAYLLPLTIVFIWAALL